MNKEFQLKKPQLTLTYLPKSQQQFKSRQEIYNHQKVFHQIQYQNYNHTMSTNFIKKIHIHSQNQIQQNKSQNLHKIKPIAKVIPPTIQKNKKIWQQQLNLNLSLKNPNIKKLIAQPISYLIRQKVYDVMLPNSQNINQKLFKIYLNRAKLILQKKQQAFFKQEYVFFVRDHLLNYFSHQFYYQNIQIMQNLESVLMSFCIHRLDLGFIKSLSQMVIVLNSFLNANPLQTFSHFCNIISAKPLFYLLTKNEKKLIEFDELIQENLEELSTSIYVIIFRKYKIPLKAYLHNWILGMFNIIYFQEQYKLDFLYFQKYMQNHQDLMVDRIFNYLFFNKFGKEAIVKMCMGIFLSIQKQIIKANTSQILYEILQRPRQYMNMTIFQDYVFK